jgi:biotin transport system substrate-specific component
MTHFLGNKLWVRITALVTGLLVCYAFGTIWFIRIYTSQTGAVGVMTALGWCVLPYLLPDGVKLVLAWSLARRLKPYI